MGRGDDKGSYNRSVEQRSGGRSKEDKDRRRKEWMIEQEKIREHERRKQRMIQEYEERRARETCPKKHSGRSSRRSRSLSRQRTRSKSSHSQDRSPRKDKFSKESSSRNLVMSEKFESPSSSIKLFRGSEGTMYTIDELKTIKTVIRRNILSSETTSEIDRKIENPEEIKLSRRAVLSQLKQLRHEDLGRQSEDIYCWKIYMISLIINCPKIAHHHLKITNMDLKDRRSRKSTCEGKKPIFERQELKKSDGVSSAVEEQRSVIAVDSNRISRSSRRRSTPSPSPKRRRYSKSPHRDSSRYRNRGDDDNRADRYENARYDREHHKDGSRENRESHRSSYRPSEGRSRDYRYRSSSRERDDSRYRRERDHDRHDIRERNGRMHIPHHYMEPMPVPTIYYDNFMRPIMAVDPMMALRNPIPIMRGRMPPVMAAARLPFGPRMNPHPPPPGFRPHGPPNLRFGRLA